MVVNRQCKLKLEPEEVINYPVKSAYRVLFQLITVGISTDERMSSNLSQLLQTSKFLCSPLDQVNLSAIKKIFGMKIEQSDLDTVFREHKADICDLVKTKLDIH